MLACYTDRLSLRPGERFALHASSTSGPCRLEIARIGGERRVVLVARVLRGHAAMVSFRRGKGEVFNGGATERAHGLAAGDPYVERITRNVLRRFGAV